ncbi:MAG: hypothetical protein ACRDTG_05945 [Pseudonocardiaceae bacterium]
MRGLINQCAGIDVGQALLVVCLRVDDDGGTVREQVRSLGTTTPDLLEDAFEVLLVNAAHLKHVPGRKTDVIDAPVDRRGALLRPSFVPPRPIRELRHLTRYRKALIRAPHHGGEPAAQSPRGRRGQTRDGGHGRDGGVRAEMILLSHCLCR